MLTVYSRSSKDTKDPDEQDFVEARFLTVPIPRHEIFHLFQYCEYVRIRISSSTVIRIPNRIRLLVYTDKASTHDLQHFFSQLGGTVSESEILTDLSAVAVHLFQLQHAVLTFLHTFLNSITKNFGRKESRIVAFKDSVLQLNVILRIE